MDQRSRAAHYLALLAQPRIGPAAVCELTRLAGGLEALVTTAWYPTSRVKQTDGSIGPPSESVLKLLRGLRSRVGAALPAAERTVADALGAGLAVITVDDPGYPPALKEGLTGPPPVLFVDGRLPRALSCEFEKLPACAVVGTRRASRFSTTFARDLACGLAKLGVVVVSGLALGIDAAAHVGAVEGARLAPEAGGATVGVLGGGHRKFHPALNRSLAAEIVASGGAVVSEWPPNVDPAPHQFLQRNRVISGLSRAVVIVEAGERSGAINTSSHALRQGRDVLVVPGRPGPAMAGNLALLRDGAKLLEGIADLDATFAEVPVIGPAIARLLIKSPAYPPNDYAGASNQPEATSTLAGRVRFALERSGEATVDQLLEELGTGSATGPDGHGPAPATVAALTGALLELELAGVVEAARNGRYHLRVSPARLRRVTKDRR